jgi:hypothetical protein
VDAAHEAKLIREERRRKEISVGILAVSDRALGKQILPSLPSLFAHIGRVYNVLGSTRA